jgi:hypothetical protein
VRALAVFPAVMLPFQEVASERHDVLAHRRCMLENRPRIEVHRLHGDVVDRDGHLAVLGVVAHRSFKLTAVPGTVERDGHDIDAGGRQCFEQHLLVVRQNFRTESGRGRAFRFVGRELCIAHEMPFQIP